MPNSEPANSGSVSRPTPPGYVTDDIQRLFKQLTAPETEVTFSTTSNTPSRADAGSIRDSINPAVQAWTWANNYAQTNQQVAAGDVGKFGYQVDIDTYFRLDGLDAFLPAPRISPLALLERKGKPRRRASKPRHA